MKQLIIASLMMVLLGFAPTAHAKPKAQAGEPVIERDGKDEIGRQVYRQEFTSPPQLAQFSESSLSWRFHMLGGSGEVYPEASIKMRCSISADGSIKSFHCKPISEPSPKVQRMMDAVGSSQVMPPRTDFRALEEWSKDGGLFGGKWVHYRHVDYELRLPSMTAPTIDLTSGRLVESSEVTINKSAAFADYPSRALRNEWEARIIAMCQVQSDLSVICTKKDIELYVLARRDNQERATRVFQKHLERGSMRLRAQETLADGTDSRGVRFELGLTYRIN